jgi:hypothetical protein
LWGCIVWSRLLGRWLLRRRRFFRWCIIWSYFSLRLIFRDIWHTFIDGRRCFFRRCLLRRFRRGLLCWCWNLFSLRRCSLVRNGLSHDSEGF